MRDSKEALGSNRKPDLTHVRKATMTYIARPCEYGSAKYERSNFLRAANPSPDSEACELAGDFLRFRAYLRAAVSHLVETLDSMELHQATDPHLADEAGLRRAAYAEDLDVTPGSSIGPSRLPHVAEALASLNMAVTQAANAGLLPIDPGTPWVAGEACASEDELEDESAEAVRRLMTEPTDIELQYEIVEVDEVGVRPRYWFTSREHAETFIRDCIGKPPGEVGRFLNRTPWQPSEFGDAWTHAVVEVGS